MTDLWPTDPNGRAKRLDKEEPMYNPNAPTFYSCTHSLRECPSCQLVREEAEKREAEPGEDPEEIAPCLVCGEPKPNKIPCDCLDEPRPTTTCFACGQDFPDRDMTRRPEGEGETCPGCTPHDTRRSGRGPHRKLHDAHPTDIDIRDLADLLASVIRRAGAAYGSPEDWRKDFTAAVDIANRASRRLKATP